MRLATTVLELVGRQLGELQIPQPCCSLELFSRYAPREPALRIEPGIPISCLRSAFPQFRANLCPACWDAFATPQPFDTGLLWTGRPGSEL